MKTTFLTLMAACLFCTNSFATVILQLTKSNKGLFGYSDVNWSYMDGSTSGGEHNLSGWVGTCINPGLKACRAPSFQFQDQTEMLVVDELLAYSEECENNGQTEGDFTKLVKVDGESFTRKYTITWRTAEKGMTALTIDFSKI